MFTFTHDIALRSSKFTASNLYYHSAETPVMPSIRIGFERSSDYPSILRASSQPPKADRCWSLYTAPRIIPGRLVWSLVYDVEQDADNDLDSPGPRRARRARTPSGSDVRQVHGDLPGQRQRHDDILSSCRGHHCRVADRVACLGVDCCCESYRGV